MGIKIFKEDIKSIDFTDLVWEVEHYEASLESVYTVVTNGATSVIYWYTRAKKPKRIKALLMRFASFLVASFGGLIPLLSDVFTVMENGKAAPLFPSSLIPIFFALAALFYGLDKYFDFTSGWMRYIETRMILIEMLEKFRLDWQIHRVKFDKEKTAEEQKEQTVVMLELARDFMGSNSDVIKKETQVWMNEFKSSFEQLGSLIKKDKPKNE
jgi:hypothetical protein